MPELALLTLDREEAVGRARHRAAQWSGLFLRIVRLGTASGQLPLDK